ARKSSAGDWPFVRAGKTTVQRTDGSEGHCSTPRGGIVARRLRTVARQHNPTVCKSDSAVEIDKVIAILPFGITGGTHDQYRPTLSRIKIRRSSDHRDGIRRHNVSALASQ